MKLEILLATMNQPDDSLLDTMGVTSDVVVCNQNPNATGYREYVRNGRKVRWYDFQEKGVGLNRNNALHRAEGDICLLADDDVMYAAGYEQMILAAFQRYPEADLIFFNIESPSGEKRTLDPRAKRVTLRNCGRYGAVRIAFRRMSVVKNAICFNQLFGGGCMFSAGEDTMFIRACLHKGLRAVAVPDCILRLSDNRPSTWFAGYTEKFFEDFGASFYCHYGAFAQLMTLVQLFRQRKKWLQETSIREAWHLARRGIAKYKGLR